MITKIKDGWTDVDVINTMPAVMGKIGPLGRFRPRGLSIPKKHQQVLRCYKQAAVEKLVNTLKP
jgi:ribosomal protein L1